MPFVCALTCRAPELFEVPSNCEIDEKTDVWSLGCTLYAMAYGEYFADGKGEMCRCCQVTAVVRIQNQVSSKI